MKNGIILSPATLEDVDFIVGVKTNPSFWPYEEDVVNADKDEVRKKVVERIYSDWHKQYIIHKNNLEKTPVGLIFLRWYIKERESWEIGFCIFPEYQRQGYCLEAAKMVLKHGFEEWNAHKVVGMCNENNIVSKTLMEKLGMTLEGIFREELPWPDRWDNQLFYCILDREYRKKEKKISS